MKIETLFASRSSVAFQHEVQNLVGSLPQLLHHKVPLCHCYIITVTSCYITVMSWYVTVASCYITVTSCYITVTSLLHHRLHHLHHYIMLHHLHHYIMLHHCYITSCYITVTSQLHHLHHVTSLLHHCYILVTSPVDSPGSGGSKSEEVSSCEEQSVL